MGGIEHQLAVYPPGVDGFVFSGHEGGSVRSANFGHRHWVPAGHLSMKTTLDTCSHLDKGLDEAAASALDEVISGRAARLASG